MGTVDWGDRVTAAVLAAPDGGGGRDGVDTG